MKRARIPSDTYIEITRPVRRGDGSYETMRLRKFGADTENPGRLSVAISDEPLQFSPPPGIALDTEDPLQILQLLEYSGVHYLRPDSPAATQGIDIFKAGRAFTLGSASEWIGFDWDFTTDTYKIYGPLIHLFAMKLLNSPPEWVTRRSIEHFEAAKPGVHELIMGLAVGYALKQGLHSFTEWERYRPQVRWFTQTWPNRLARLGTDAIPLVPLLMGRYPGTNVDEESVRRSDAFITLEDFARQITGLLERFQRSGCQFSAMAPHERDHIMELLVAGKARRIKSVSAFIEKGWTPPTLVFDDSPAIAEAFRKEGVKVVHMINPVVPGAEIIDLDVLSLGGRRRTARRMAHLASRTEGLALIEALKRLTRGETNIALSTHDLAPTPEGSILVLNNLLGTIGEMLREYRTPQREIKQLIREIIQQNGGMGKLKDDYLKMTS